MLDAERALAHAHGLGVDDELFDVSRYDVAEIGMRAAEGGNPVIPLVELLRQAAPDLHRSATSQDILDTATMLVAKRALDSILPDAAAAADACAELAREHRDTPQLGRTLLRQGLPRSFGLTAAGWMRGIDAARAVLGGVRLAAQLGGPVGALDDEALVGRCAAELGLEAPDVPWHADRVGIAGLASALGLLGGALGKVGVDVSLLAQDEVAELRDTSAGGSSSMPHKANPVAAVAVVACARRLPGLVATMQSAMLGEHQRAAGSWHAEWETLSDLLRLTGSAAAWARSLLEGLEVDGQRMGENLAAAAERHGFDAGDGVAGAAALVDRALAAR